MVLAHKQFDAIDEAGNLLTGVQVTVQLEGGGLAALFSDRAGSSGIGNPVTFADGKVDFYVAGGAYKITLTKGSYTRELRYVPVGLLQESDSLPVDDVLQDIADLADPNADRILFWDDSLGAYTYLSLAPSLVISGTELRNLEVWGVALSDETTAITTGTAKASFSIPYQFKVVGVYATLNTVSSSGTPTFDVNEAGSSILGTKIVIDQSEFTGGSSGYQGTAAGAATISDDTIAAFAQITWDIDTAGTGAKGAKGYLVGYRNS